MCFFSNHKSDPPEGSSHAWGSCSLQDGGGVTVQSDCLFQFRQHPTPGAVEVGLCFSSLTPVDSPHTGRLCPAGRCLRTSTLLDRAVPQSPLGRN